VETTIQVSARLFTQAACIAKLTALQGSGTHTLENTLVRVYHDSIRLTSTCELLASDVRVPLDIELPDFEGDPYSFLVKPAALFDLAGVSSDALFIFSVNSDKHSLTLKTSKSSLTLPIRGSEDWPDIDDRLVPDTVVTPQDIDKGGLKEAIRYSKYFMASTQDPAMNLIEIRNNFAIATDRAKFGFLEIPALQGVRFKLPGDQLASLDKIIDAFPEPSISLTSTASYTLFTIDTPFHAVVGFLKCMASLPEGFDKVPLANEPEHFRMDLVDLSKSLARLAIVCSKLDPRVKFEVSGASGDSSVTISTINETGHESKESVSVFRVSGGPQKNSIVVPLSTIQKALKLLSGTVVHLKIGAGSKYLKFVNQTSSSTSYSVFQSLGSLAP